jgi:hypothetical protein
LHACPTRVGMVIGRWPSDEAMPLAAIRISTSSDRLVVLKLFQLTQAQQHGTPNIHRCSGGCPSRDSPFPITNSESACDMYTAAVKAFDIFLENRAWVWSVVGGFHYERPEADGQSCAIFLT